MSIIIKQFVKFASNLRFTVIIFNILIGIEHRTTWLFRPSYLGHRYTEHTRSGRTEGEVRLQHNTVDSGNGG